MVLKPMRSIIPDLLWIGNAADARDVRAVLSLGVQAVIDLAASEPPISFPRDIAYCRFPLNDGPGNAAALLQMAIKSTAELVSAKIPVLVSCGAGMSRSVAVAAAALALADNQPPDEALRRVAATGPHDVTPALWGDILKVMHASGAQCESEENSPALSLLVLKSRQVEQVLAFYQTLGLEFVEERHGEGPLHYAAKLGNVVFELYPAAASDSAESAVRLGFNAARLMETVEVLRSTGVQIASEPKETRWGMRAVVRDPNGRVVELYQQPLSERA